ncbi:nuclear transport factor 2 family protein [Pelomonas sp. Root1217]|uniref:nuclear transport factor 2 family protein n=1 Tax=Pelomonas sp. Root1217 TaxID=1736430 RepID=UPI000A526DAF
MTMPAHSCDARTSALIDAYVDLTRDRLAALMALYDEQAAFKDPFNDVIGRAAITHIFSDMFEQLREPRFDVLHAATEGDDAFLTWELHFRRQSGGSPMTIRGASHLRYSPAGLVVLHRDYWDAAEELYAKLPVLGGLMRMLRRRLSASRR